MLDLTRGLPAPEHREHTPKRNIHASHQRDLAKQRMTRRGKTPEVRYGYRTPLGQTVMALTDSEVAAKRQQDLINKQYEAALRKQRASSIHNTQVANTDTWASKS